MSPRPEIIKNSPELWQQDFPVPQADGHKYHRGHTVVLSGGPTQTGAARLAAQAALRVGSGLVTLYSPPDAVLVNAAHLTAIMLKSVKGPERLSQALKDRRITSVILGPALGVGEPARKQVETVLASGKASVLDADALTSFADNPADLFAAIKKSTDPVVLTPHRGEFGVLFGEKGAATAQKPVAAVLDAARTSGAIVVLKGAHTLVANPSTGELILNRNAPPWLATAGSGDVLAGIIGGLLAQGMPAFQAVCAGVWLHGEAGNICGPGLTAQDLDGGLLIAVGNMIKQQVLAVSGR